MEADVMSEEKLDMRTMSTYEQVVSGHSGLSGDTGGDNDDFSALEGRGDAKDATRGISTLAEKKSHR
jgi:hypothetical protein